MKLKLLTIVGAMSLFAFCNTANAAVVVDPVTGGDYVFGWESMGEEFTPENDGGLGPIDYIVPDGGTEWSLSLAVGAEWSIFVEDQYAPGDEFALTVNGFVLPWDTVTYVNGYFTAFLSGFLPAGTYTASLIVTERAYDYDSDEYFTSGAARAVFVPISPIAAVPLPATLPLIIAAIGAFGLIRRRKANQSS